MRASAEPPRRGGSASVCGRLSGHAEHLRGRRCARVSSHDASPRPNVVVFTGPLCVPAGSPASASSPSYQANDTPPTLAQVVRPGARGVLLGSCGYGGAPRPLPPLLLLIYLVLSSSLASFSAPQRPLAFSLLTSYSSFHPPPSPPRRRHPRLQPRRQRLRRHPPQPPPTLRRPLPPMPMSPSPPPVPRVVASPPPAPCSVLRCCMPCGVRPCSTDPPGALSTGGGGTLSPATRLHCRRPSRPDGPCKAASPVRCP